jgi:hypothetical protein
MISFEKTDTFLLEIAKKSFLATKKKLTRFKLAESRRYRSKVLGGFTDA